MTRLTLRQVEVALGSFHLALDLDLQPGCIGVFGPSGAGKTTLLEVIAGLRRARAGTLVLNDDVLAEAGNGKWIPPHRRGIGYVPQDLALFPHLDVRANILYGAPKSDTDTGECSVDSLIEILSLKPLLDRSTDGLSGGERQRVALARALAAKPRLLLLDEPLTGLDQDRKDSVLDYLRLLRERWAVPMIYVSHQADEMAGLCDEVIVLRDGALLGSSTPGEVFERTGHLPGACVERFAFRRKRGMLRNMSDPSPCRCAFSSSARYEKLGCASTVIAFPEDGTQASLWRALGEKFPVTMPTHVRLARDNEFLDVSAPLRPGDELALIPAVSGG